MRRLALLAVAALLVGCEEGPPIEVDTRFDAEAIAFLNQLQPRSIRENREYCGFFGVDAEGRFVATEPQAGWLDGCEFAQYPRDMDVAASYHTHAAFDPQADSEVPSGDDIRADIRLETFGYISTPGGRVWLVDWQRRRASQLCGTGCVYADPRFRDNFQVAQSYSAAELIRRSRGF